MNNNVNNCINNFNKNIHINDINNNINNSNKNININNNINNKKINNLPNNNNINVKNDMNNNLNYKIKNLSNEKLKNYNLNIPYFVVGLENIGSTCYMNAILQCLSHCEELTNYFLRQTTINLLNNDYIKYPLSYAYYTVISNLFPLQPTENRFKPTFFRNTIAKLNNLFLDMKANDSKDLLLFILERLHEELKKNNNSDNNNIYNIINIPNNDRGKKFKLFLQNFKKEDTSVISHYFFGVNESLIKCQNCNNIIYDFQIFNFMIFPLEEAKQYICSKGPILIINNRVQSFMNLLNKVQNNKVKLHDCFEYNERLITFENDNMIYCNNCNQLSVALSQVKIYNAPVIFCIILNRGKNNKYLVNVEFPEILDLSKFIHSNNSKKIYELIGIVTHLGESGQGGHFIAFCKSRVDKKWYCFNDSLVSDSSFDKAKNFGVPYILFYHLNS